MARLDGVYESLAALLSKCMEFLDRLTYNARGGMDAKLTKVACQHLQLFVEICDRVVRLRDHKRYKIGVFVRILFLNDNGIEGLLDSMKGLVDKEGNLVAAQMFNFSSEAATNSREGLALGRRMDNKVDSLVDDRNEQKKEKDVQIKRRMILDALAFDEDKLDEKKEPKASWESTYNNYRRLVIPNTGAWIPDDPVFVAWLNGDQSSKPILALEGVEGSGKSF